MEESKGSQNTQRGRGNRGGRGGHRGDNKEGHRGDNRGGQRGGHRGDHRGDHRGGHRGGHNSQEEQNLDRHPRRNNRGGYGRGGKAYDKPFENREYEGQRAENSQRGQRGNRGRGNRGGRGQRGRGGHNRPREINAPKDSYYYRYFYGPYPEIEEIEVTLESELPSIKEEDKLQLPSEQEYAKHMQECDDKIQELRTKITSINDEKRAKITNKKQDRTENPEIESSGKNFKQLVGEKNKLVNERRELNEITEKLNHKLTAVTEEMRKMNKFIDKECNTVEEVEKKIKLLNKKMTTESLPVAKEKEVFKQIQFLEKSRPFYEDYEHLRKKQKAIKDQIFEEKGKIGKLSKTIKSYNTTLDEMNEEFKSKKENTDTFKSDLEKLENKVQDIKKEIGVLFEKKNEIREQHYKQKFNYECQVELQNYYDYLQEQKDELQREEKERLKQEAEVKRKEDEKLEHKKNMPNPFADEINQCGYLITQLRLKKRDHDTTIAKAEIEAQRREMEEERKKEIEKQQEAGKILIHTKEEDPLPMSKKQKKKQKQKQMKGEPTTKPVEVKETPKDPSKVKIDLKYDVVKGLIELGIEVPENTVEDIDKTIEKLYQIKDKYEERGKEKIEKVFRSDNWKEEYEKHLQGPEADLLIVEEEEKKYEDKPKQKKHQSRYVRDEASETPLA